MTIPDPTVPRFSCPSCKSPVMVASIHPANDARAVSEWRCDCLPDPGWNEYRRPSPAAPFLVVGLFVFLVVLAVGFGLAIAWTRGAL